MASIDDLASDQEAFNLQIALTHLKTTLQPRGRCWLDGCEEPVKTGVLFCGVDCRDEWERLRRLREIKGVK